MKKLFLIICALFSSSSDAGQNSIVVIKTTMGDITVELNNDKAPKTVASFLGAIKIRAYSDTIFHLTQSDFMIMGGAYNTSLEELPSQPSNINEADNGLLNEKGTIALNINSNSQPIINEFYINTSDNAFLDHKPEAKENSAYSKGHPVFGKVIKGMDVVTLIANVETTTKGPFRDNVPVENIIIKSISIVK